MLRWIYVGPVFVVLSSVNLLPASATTLEQTASPAAATVSHRRHVAGLFDVIRVIDDIDDISEGRIEDVTIVKRTNRKIENALDDVTDEIEDFDRDARRTGRRVERRVDEVTDDIEDWFD
jgi:hypothetical protein